jgi:hypothetical protein
MQQLTKMLLQAYSYETGVPETLPDLGAALPGKTRSVSSPQAADLFTALAAVHHCSVEAILYHFGVFLLSTPLVDYADPSLLRDCPSARVLVLERIGHLAPLVLQDLAGAEAVHLETISCATDLLEVRYRGPVSPLRLCFLLYGSIAGAGRRFQTLLQVQELACQSQGVLRCRIAVRFPTPAGAGPMGSSQLEGRQANPDELGDSRAALPQRHGRSWSEAAPGEEMAREQEEDVLVLRLLALHASAAPSSETAAPAGMTLDEIWKVLRRRPYTAPYAHALQRTLNRLVAQGYLMWSSARLAPPRKGPSQRSGQDQGYKGGGERCYRMTDLGMRRLAAASWPSLKHGEVSS